MDKPKKDHPWRRRQRKPDKLERKWTLFFKGSHTEDEYEELMRLLR